MTLVLKTIAEARQWVKTERARGKTIGLVPTMGFLHEGHLSLIRRARQTCDRVVVSIFVNPLQFGPEEDYDRYPRELDRDLALLDKEQVDAAFYPSVQEMYSTASPVSISAGALSQTLCGAWRPGHFRGVATVVAKLLNIVQADRVFFGQKDAQQAVIVQAMVRDLNFPVEVEVCPIVRESDGLAMSSRNVYLTPEQRAQATVLYRSLEQARNLIRSGTRDAVKVEQAMRDMIEAVSGAGLDYARVVDSKTLQDVREIKGEVLVAVAVRFGKTRLIDNMIVAVEQ